MIRSVFILLIASILAITSSTQVLAQAPKYPTKYYVENGLPYWDPNDNEILCGGGAVAVGNIGTGGTVAADFNLGTDPAERRVNLIKALMNDYGLTAEQASGPVGNFMHESGGEHIPPDVNEALGIPGDGPGPPRRVIPGVNTGGYGWAQWTGARKTSFIEFAIDSQYMGGWNVHGNDAANYAYLKKELSEGYTTTITELKKQSTPEDAAVSFEATFERAGVPALEPRKANARKAFTEYMSGGNVGTPINAFSGGCASPGSSAILGNVAFPLQVRKADIQNRNIFRNGTTDLGGHPYTAYDILVNTGTPVVAFMGGTVTRISEDKCPGRMITVYNEEADMVISYLHLSMNTSTHVAQGAVLQPGDPVGIIGTASEGCKIPHLHIDAVKGRVRVGCKRESCSTANKALFVDIGPQLYETYQVLPD